jgi:hypothetical protein
LAYQRLQDSGTMTYQLHGRGHDMTVKRLYSMGGNHTTPLSIMIMISWTWSLAWVHAQLTLLIDPKYMRRHQYFRVRETMNCTASIVGKLGYELCRHFRDRNLARFQETLLGTLLEISWLEGLATVSLRDPWRQLGLHCGEQRKGWPSAARSRKLSSWRSGLMIGLAPRLMATGAYYPVGCFAQWNPVRLVRWEYT